MIELAMSATVMTMFLAGTFQFGYTFYVYNQLVTAIGNGSRYAAMRTYARRHRRTSRKVRLLSAISSFTATPSRRPTQRP